MDCPGVAFRSHVPLSREANTDSPEAEDSDADVVGLSPSAIRFGAE
jgi:hypothetical protein